jgi:hypothetical protein
MVIGALRRRRTENQDCETKKPSGKTGRFLFWSNPNHELVFAVKPPFADAASVFYN